MPRYYPSVQEEGGVRLFTKSHRITYHATRTRPGSFAGTISQASPGRRDQVKNRGARTCRHGEYSCHAEMLPVRRSPSITSLFLSIFYICIELQDSRSRKDHEGDLTSILDSWQNREQGRDTGARYTACPPGRQKGREDIVAR